MDWVFSHVSGVFIKNIFKFPFKILNTTTITQYVILYTIYFYLLSLLSLKKKIFILFVSSGSNRVLKNLRAGTKSLTEFETQYSELQFLNIFVTSGFMLFLCIYNCCIFNVNLFERK